jgi:hypothetical protein
MVNSIATTWPIGISVSAKNQQAAHREAAVAMDQRIQETKADHGAQLHELEHVHLAHRLSAGDNDDQHQRQPTGHPKGRLGFRRCPVHR